MRSVERGPRARAGLAVVVAVPLAGLALAWTGVALADGPGTGNPQLAEVQAGGVVVLSRGSNQGVKLRQVYDIMDEGRGYALPLTDGKRFKSEYRVVGSAVVYEVAPDKAWARVFTKGKLEVKSGLYAVLNEKANAPELPSSIRAQKPEPKESTAAWRRPLVVSVDADVEPGRRAFFEWKAPEGSTFTRGVEVAPGTFRTVQNENTWLAPWAKGTFQGKVKLVDSQQKGAQFPLSLTSTGPESGAPRAFRSPRTVISRTEFKGLRDLTFDHRNNMFFVDGSAGTFSGEQTLHGVSPDGIDLGSATVGNHDFAAIAINEDFFYAIDAKEGALLRYARGNDVSQLLRGEVQKLATSGEGNGAFKNPVDLALATDGSVYVLDAGQRCVQRFDSDGRFAYSFGRPGDRAHELKRPVALAATEDGSVLVLDAERRRIVVYRNGRVVGDDLDVGTPTEELGAIAVDPFGGTILVLETRTGGVKRFDANGQPLGAVSVTKDERDPACLKKPVRIRVDATSLVHVLDRSATSIARFDVESGAFVSRLGGSDFLLTKELRIAASPDGNVAVLDRDREVAFRFDQRGWVTARMGGAEGEGKLRTPLGIAVDAEGQVYVVDAKRAEVLKFQAAGGGFLAALGGGGLKSPLSLSMSSQRERLLTIQDRDEDHVTTLHPRNRGDVSPFNVAECDNPELSAFLGRFDPSAPKEEKGYYWIVDKSGERVRVLDLQKNELTPDFDPKLKKVTGIAASIQGVVFLCDGGRKTIDLFQGRSRIGELKDDSVPEPQDVATDDLGRVFVFDRSKGKIVEFTGE